VNGVLQSTGFQSALQQAISRTPAQAQSPLEMLQEFSQQLDTFTSDEELLDGFEVILQNFGDYEKVYASPQINFKFPQDLIRGVDVSSIMSEVELSCSKALARSARSIEMSTQVKVQELKDDDEDAEEDSEEAEEEESPNFIAMIDKVLSKVDPAKFLTMVEKLNDALPPPGQTVFKPLIDALQQACENKAKLQGKAEAAQAQVGTVSARAKGSLAEARTSGVELANVNDVKLRDVRIDVDGSTPQTGLKIAWIIIGAMALFGTITICFLIAMAFSKDCGCNNECEAAQKWAAACPAICEC